jgi:hypothetical protein
MSPHAEAQRRAWMEQWRAAGPALERVRLQELATADLGRIAESLEDACLAAVSAADPARISGLVVQQQILRGEPPR